MNVNQQTLQFADWYGPGLDGTSPTETQWANLLGRAPDKPVTLINFFKLRENALYQDKDVSDAESVSGQEAFSNYASVSVPAMERAGGRFLYVGPFQGMFLGETEDWDLIAIGAYPDLKAFTTLYSDEAYRSAFHHRTAACERQKVLVCGD